MIFVFALARTLYVSDLIDLYYSEIQSSQDYWKKLCREGTWKSKDVAKNGSKHTEAYRE